MQGPRQAVTISLAKFREHGYLTSTSVCHRLEQQLATSKRFQEQEPCRASQEHNALVPRAHDQSRQVRCLDAVGQGLQLTRQQLDAQALLWRWTSL